MIKKGKVIVRKSKKGKWVFEVDIGEKQPMKIPNFYDLKDDSLNGRECEVEKDKGQIRKIAVDGNELPRKKQEQRHLKEWERKEHTPSDIFNIDNTMLPKDTRETLKKEKIDNFELRLNKTPFFDSDEKFKFFIVDRKKGAVLNVHPDYSKLDINAISEKHKCNIEKLNIIIKSIILKPEWRMVIGLGSESVYETSITLHHIYGIPYIPGSAIKGVIRSYIITEEFESNEEKALEEDKGFCDIFGCPKKSIYDESRQGKIIFFDSFPRSNPQIEPDVLNPHYSPYYSDSSNKVPPADYHNPVPIPFLTVKNTEFEFIVGINKKDNRTIQEGKFLGNIPLEVAYKSIKEALCEHGIGAKTSVGYGYMI